MGCDIHSMAEVYVEPYNYTVGSEVRQLPGKWLAIDAPMWDNPYYREGSPIEPYNTPYLTEPVSSRNYALFSWLAGVRGELDPFIAPRGIPEDASKKWKKYAKKWGSDLHTLSYLTLTELIESEKAAREAQVPVVGTIPLSSYKALKRDDIKPESWAGWTNLPTIDSTEFDEMSPSVQDALASKIHVRAQWEYPLWDSVGWFYEHTVERMKNLASSRSADHVRLVFGFDN